MNIPEIAEIFTDIDERYILEAAEKEDVMIKKINIKRTLAVAAACLCAVCLMAAGWALFDSKDYLSDFDADPSYMTQDKMITSDGEGHYFGVIMCRNGFRLMGSDGSAGEDAYNICDVPGCDHTDGSVCLALNRPEFTGLSVYDGRLYWTARPKTADLAASDDTVNIMSSELDGSDIRTVRGVSGEVFADTQYNKYIRVHRGYVYFIGVRAPEEIFDPETMTSHKKDPGEKYVLNVWAEELAENGGSEKIFSLDYEDGRSYSYTSQFYANSLYIMVRSTASDGADCRFEVYAIDLKSCVGKKIFSTDRYDINGWWLDGSEVLYYTETDPETEKCSLMRLDLGRGKPEKMFELPGSGRVINGKAVCLDGNAHKVTVCGFDGSRTELGFDGLAELVTEKYGYMGIALCGVDSENVILQMCDDECFAIVPLDGSEPKLLIASCVSDPGFVKWF